MPRTVGVRLVKGLLIISLSSHVLQLSDPLRPGMPNHTMVAKEGESYVMSWET